MDNNLEIIVSTIIAIHVSNVKEILLQSSIQLERILQKYRQNFVEILLLNMLENASLTQYLEIGPLLRYYKEKRSIWMKERSHDWWTRIVKNNFNEADYIETFRMRKETFKWLCDALRDELTPNIIQLKTREPISVEKQIGICLYFLASCCEYRVVGNNFGVHKSTVWKCVHRVVDCINKKLMAAWITMPDNAECEEIASCFKAKTNIDQLIGAIDGTHIPILPPSDGYRDFINRKGWPSIILQAVVDNNYRFRNIHCGTPGSSHDAAVFQSSKLYKEHHSLIPNKSKLVNNVEIPYIIMGDPAYPLLPWLIKGYTRNNRLTPEEESFNVYLNSGRVCVEIAFGRLKARWRRLLKRIDVHYTYVPNIVTACCILHNIVETRMEQMLHGWENAISESNIVIPQPEGRQNRNLDNIEATNIRDALKQYLCENYPLRRSFLP